MQAVHSGEDFEAAAKTVMGYRQESVKGKAIDIPPVKGVATEHLVALLSKVLPRKDSAATAANGNKSHASMAEAQPSQPWSNGLDDFEPKVTHYMLRASPHTAAESTSTAKQMRIWVDYAASIFLTECCRGTLCRALAYTTKVSHALASMHCKLRTAIR